MQTALPLNVNAGRFIGGAVRRRQRRRAAPPSLRKLRAPDGLTPPLESPGSAANMQNVAFCLIARFAVNQSKQTFCTAARPSAALGLTPACRALALPLGCAQPSRLFAAPPAGSHSSRAAMHQTGRIVKGSAATRALTRPLTMPPGLVPGANKGQGRTLPPSPDCHLIGHGVDHRNRFIGMIEQLLDAF